MPARIPCRAGLQAKRRAGGREKTVRPWSGTFFCVKTTQTAEREQVSGAVFDVITRGNAIAIPVSIF